MRVIRTNQQKVMVLQKIVLSQKDIQTLFDCGSVKAKIYANSFREWFAKENGYELYPGQIPTREFVRYTHYPEDRVIKYAKLGY